MSFRAMASLSWSMQLLPIAALHPSTRPHSLFVTSATVSGRRSGFGESFKQLAVTHANPSEARQRVKVYGGIRGSSEESSSSPGLAATKDKFNKLEGVKLYDPNGAVVSLVGLWESRTAVVAFGRHFGCILCRKRADVLQSRKAEMDAAGVALVLIAPGSPEQARKFIEQTNFTGEVYADPDHGSYEALDFVNGVNSVLNPKSGSRIAKAFAEGYRQDWALSFDQDTVQRGGWQQGGILVAGRGTDTVRYLFKDAEAGDEPNLEDVMSACCSNSP